MPNYKTLTQTLCAAFCAILSAVHAAPLEGGGVMRLAMRNIFSDDSRPESRMTLNLNSANISALTCNINGLTNATLFGWARNLPGYSRAASWTEGSGGWGGTYFAITNNTAEVRFGSGSSNSKKQFSFTRQPDTWYHFCFVRNASDSSYKFYLNGALSETQSGKNTALRNNANTFNLAKGLNGASTTTDTSYVAYGIFSRALTASEVSAMYEQRLIDKTKAPFNNGLLMGLNVTEGEGNKIYDVVSGNYVTINSTPNWTVEFNP